MDQISMSDGSFADTGGAMTAKERASLAKRYLTMDLRPKKPRGMDPKERAQLARLYPTMFAGGQK
jgi:hypothetical protein